MSHPSQAYRYHSTLNRPPTFTARKKLKSAKKEKRREQKLRTRDAMVIQRLNRRRQSSQKRPCRFKKAGVKRDLLNSDHLALRSGVPISASSSSILRLMPPSTWMPFCTHSMVWMSSRLLRPRDTFFRRPSTQDRAPSQPLPFSESHSPSSSPNRTHIQSQRAIR